MKILLLVNVGSLEKRSYRLKFYWDKKKWERSPKTTAQLIYCKARTGYTYKTSRLVRISLLISILNKEFCCLLGKVIFKSNRKRFSCICMGWYKHSRGWKKSRQSQTLDSSSWICISTSNSSNPSSVYIRLCKQENSFLLLKFCFLKTIFQLAIPAFLSRNIVLNIVHFLLTCNVLCNAR